MNSEDSHILTSTHECVLHVGDLEKMKGKTYLQESLHEAGIFSGYEMGPETQGLIIYRYNASRGRQILANVGRADED